MTVRTTSKTVTFMHPFNLSGTDEVQPAGTYTVETDEELLEPLSFPAYRRISTMIRLSARTTGTVLTQIVETNPVELAGALARDVQPDETMPQPAYSEAVVPRKRAGGRMGSFREGWKHWVALNATDLDRIGYQRCHIYQLFDGGVTNVGLSPGEVARSR